MDSGSVFTLKLYSELKPGNKSVQGKCSQRTDKHSHTVRTHRRFCRDSDRPSEDKDEAGSCSSGGGSDVSTGEHGIDNEKLDDTR